MTNDSGPAGLATGSERSTVNRREFTVANEHRYDTRTPLRWLTTHIVRYPVLLVTFVLTTAGMGATQSLSAVLVGRAFDTVIDGLGVAALTTAAIWVVMAYVGFGLFDIVNNPSFFMVRLGIFDTETR